MDGDENNQENTCLCCRPLMPETPYFKKMKPILIAGLRVYSIVGLLDAFYLKHYNLMDFLLIILFLSLMTFNRCYIIFHLYTIFSIILLFIIIIPYVGIPLQTNFESENAEGTFIIYTFLLIFYFVFYYFAFQIYKDLKYSFMNGIGIRPQLSSGLASDYPQNNNDYNYGNSGNNYNNNNTPSSGGFKAFSGKGYTVGGS